MSEHLHQCGVILWCQVMSNQEPGLRSIFAIPNGANKSFAAAMKFKAEGLKAGVPDLFLPVPRQPWHGLFIEMKDTKGKLSDPQKEWHTTLSRQGYLVQTCHSADLAIETIKQYLGMK